MDFDKENLPKTKDDWNALKEQDIDLWADLTQDNYDRTLREKRELESKFKDTESQKNNLTAELTKYRQSNKPEDTITVPVIKPDKEYSRDNLPGSKEEWEKLLIVDPVLGTDLRTFYNSNVASQEKNFWETRAKTQRMVQEEHPDMYEAELDESNQPKRDGNGKIVLKRDAQSGEVIFSPNSEKGKLWEQIYNENPGIEKHANAPELLQAAMERKLRLKGNQIITEVKSQRDRQIIEGQVISEGLTPPTNVKITFHSEEEKGHAQRMVDKGLYKNLTDYVVNRDRKDDGIFDENRMPSFTKK